MLLCTALSAATVVMSACAGSSSQTSNGPSSSYQQGYNDGADWARKNYVQQPGPQSGLPDYVVTDWCRMFLSRYQNGLNSPMPASTGDYMQGCHDGFGVLGKN